MNPADAGPEIVRRVLTALAGRGETLASCESLTGGLVGTMITSVPGASSVYRGGLITYATALKAELAGVAGQTLERYGAVAAETASEMAAGALRVCGADWGLATTGVAGPDPQEGHPAGTVFVAVARSLGVPAAGESESVAEQLSLTGTRDQIRTATVTALFALLERRLSAAGGGVATTAVG